MWEYYIQADGKVRRMSERDLRDKMRKGKYSGMELVRRADEQQWQPLHETTMFREEVPMTGSPLDYARWRMVRSFGIHLLAYVAVNVLTGFAPPIFLFWGIGIVLHGVKALPSGLELWREGKVPFLPQPKQPPALRAAPGPAQPGGSPKRQVTAPQPLPPSSAASTSGAAMGAASSPLRASSSQSATIGDPSPSASLPFDPTIDVPPPSSASASASVEDRQLRAAVRSKLFGGDASTPMRIGRYRLDERVGSGGMGVVFRAHDETLDRAVAVKLLRPGYEAEAGTERLQREARAMARLNHPNVVTVFDVGTFETSVFVAMEYVDGVTLREWLGDARSVGDMISVLRQAGEGLSAAHAAGLVHRDFKPENVIVGRDGRVRVLDFGLAKPVDAHVTHDLLTQSGTVLGTPRYMSPEQFRGEPAGEVSDQFSFGVVAFEAIYGTHPYEPADDKPLPRSVLAGKLRQAPVRADVPPAVRDALMRAVAHDPEQRHESMQALLDAFGPIPTTSDELASLAAAVRRQLTRRPGAEAQQMLKALDSIEQVVAELDAKAAAIASQVKADQSDRLQRELADVETRLDGTDDDADRKLLQQQVQSLQERLSGIARAREVLDRLRTRRSVAEHHLQQLHLDLTRAEASATDLPDLTGPLQELRFQVDAAQEVEALLR